MTNEPKDIDERIARVRSTHRDWVDAHEAHLRAKTTKYLVEAELYIEHRERLNRATGRATEAQVDAACRLDARDRRAQEAVIASDVARLRTLGALELARAELRVVLGPVDVEALAAATGRIG